MISPPHDTTPSTGEAAEIPLLPKTLSILCVEDNEGDFVLVREHLTDAHFYRPTTLSRATSLAEGLKMLAGTSENGEPPFDVILLDLSLPDSEGSSTLEQIKLSSQTAPVIILSGNEDRALAVEMVQLGAQDYLPKYSLNGDLLLRAILYALERQRFRLKMTALNERLQQTSEDLKSAQMQLIQAEKLDSLGRLAAGVAHEVKNPLATLQMGVDFLQPRSDTLGENGTVIINHMQAAITSADHIIRGMLAYSRSDSLKIEYRNINEIIEKALHMIGHEVIRHNIEVERYLTSPLPAVRVDQQKIEQVLINLLVNAIHAMKEIEETRTLRVSTYWNRLEAVTRDEGLRDYERLRVQDHAVVIEIRDHGTGIPEDKLTRIFEPFFTTKPTGEGTGLGLSVVRNIIDLHRGRIEICNVENPRGVRVRIFLKAHQITEELKQESPATALFDTQPITPNPRP
ncbi:MAG: response regulator [Verrucomicrobiales bacterium]|nr:response regulator [Verrucomicrobiales bacterium]